MDAKWNVPILLVDPKGQNLVIASNREAAEWLMMHMPARPGDKLSVARVACHLAFAGEIPLDVARKAFIEAAEDANHQIFFNNWWDYDSATHN